MSAVVLIAVIWLLVGLLLGVALGRAMSRTDAREAADRAARLAHHPSARQLTEAEVQQRIREMEKRWVA